MLNITGSANVGHYITMKHKNGTGICTRGPGKLSSNCQFSNWGGEKSGFFPPPSTAKLVG